MAQETDHFYTQSYRYGPKNQRLRAYNRDRAMTGMNGYPNDKQYMKAVADAGKERDSEKMSVEGRQEASKYEKKRKVATTGSGKPKTKSKATRKKVSAKR
jgi:hypothetical protein